MDGQEETTDTPHLIYELITRDKNIIRDMVSTQGRNMCNDPRTASLGTQSSSWQQETVHLGLGISKSFWKAVLM